MKSRLRQCFVWTGVSSLLLFLSFWWLPQGTQHCEQSWRPCVRGEVGVRVGHTVSRALQLDDDDSVHHVLKECPGQSFQVARLLHHLSSALGPASDVLLEPYLLCWEELIKFMESLGPLVGFFTGKVEEKITLIRELSDEKPKANSPGTELPAYHSVRSMLDTELKRGMVSFHEQTPSGSRTLLRLHRSLLWLQLLLEKLGSEPEERTMGELCREAYLEVLAPHHPWLVQRAAELVFRAMPDRSAFLSLVCVKRQKDAEPVIRIIVTAIQEIHHRTQTELERRNMLDLP